jgi:hypothetical protein
VSETHNGQLYIQTVLRVDRFVRTATCDGDYMYLYQDEGKMRGLRADTKRDVACFDD